MYTRLKSNPNQCLKALKVLLPLIKHFALSGSRFERKRPEPSQAFRNYSDCRLISFVSACWEFRCDPVNSGIGKGPGLMTC